MREANRFYLLDLTKRNYKKVALILSFMALSISGSAASENTENDSITTTQDTTVVNHAEQDSIKTISDSLVIENDEIHKTMEWLKILQKMQGDSADIWENKEQQAKTGKEKVKELVRDIEDKRTETKASKNKYKKHKDAIDRSVAKLGIQKPEKPKETDSLKDKDVVARDSIIVNSEGHNIDEAVENNEPSKDERIAQLEQDKKDLMAYGAKILADMSHQKDSLSKVHNNQPAQVATKLVAGSEQQQPKDNMIEPSQSETKPVDDNSDQKPDLENEKVYRGSAKVPTGKRVKCAEWFKDQLLTR